MGNGEYLVDFSFSIEKIMMPSDEIGKIMMEMGRKNAKQKSGQRGLGKQAWPLEGRAPSCGSLEASGAPRRPLWSLDPRGPAHSCRAAPSPVLLEDE